MGYRGGRQMGLPSKSKAKNSQSNDKQNCARSKNSKKNIGGE